MFFLKKNILKYGVIEQNIDNLTYVITFEDYSICECLVFDNDNIYDYYVMDYSSQTYKNKEIKEYVKI